MLNHSRREVHPNVIAFFKNWGCHRRNHGAVCTPERKENYLRKEIKRGAGLHAWAKLKSKLNQIQIEFRIYFSTQIKIENFSRLSKIKFITF